MRLLQRDDNGYLRLTKELGRDVPPYAILSHTWGDDEEEVTFQDMQQRTGHNKTGYGKLEFCANQAARDGFDVFWCDTCCIDKTNSTELAEAINSMFRWYREAAVCYVYLQDVTCESSNDTADTDPSEPLWIQSFRQCRWLRRGWTLQELIAPKSVVFFDAAGRRLGDKNSLIDLLEQTTTIPAATLRGQPLSTFSVEARMSWRGNRQTKREEDRVYSLLGIFDVYLPLLYGEGEQRAESRLWEEVHKRAQGYYESFTKDSAPAFPPPAVDLRPRDFPSALPTRIRGVVGHDLMHNNNIDDLRDLFHSAKARVEKVVPEADFGIQSSILLSQFEADKQLFYQWGKEADLRARDSAFEHSLAKDFAHAAAVRETLLGIVKVMSISNDSAAHQRPSQQLDTNTTATMSFADVVLRVSHATVVRKPDETQTTSSSLKQKMRFVAAAQRFRFLVEELYEVTSRRSAGGALLMHSTRRKRTGGITDRSSQFHAQKFAWEEIERQIQREARRDLETWLNGYRSDVMYDDVLQKKLTGTCDWVQERSAFQQWKLEISPPGHAKLLWITGPAGYGKTVLSGSIIRHLQDLSLSPFYFFFSADLEDRSDPFIVIRSWISQLVSSSQDAFITAWDDQEIDVARRASSRQIVALFKKLVLQAPNCIFIVDGLDECTEKAGWAGLESRSLVSFVQALVEAIAGSTSRVLIVSREQQDIRDGLSSIPPDTYPLDFTEYKISEEDIRPDATLLSHSIVGRKLSNKPQSTQDELARMIVEKSNSMLLHIKLLERDLRGGKNQKQLERIVSQAPNQLANLYDRNWQRILENDTDRSRALAILRWATFAHRSITVYELTEALLAAEEDANESLQENMPDAIDEEFLKTEILDLCHSLVEARVNGSSQDVGSRTIHLTHFTVREYLLQRDPITGTGSALHANNTLQQAREFEHNILLADVCLRYLKVKGIWNTGSEQQQDTSQGQEVYQGRLKNYATTFWRWHVKFDSPHYPKIAPSIAEFFCAPAYDHAWENWRRHFEETPIMSNYVRYTGELANTNRLFYASYLGLTVLVRHMVEEKKVDVNVVDSSRRTALFGAAALGHWIVTAYLLEKNADVDIAGQNMYTPLLVSCRLGRLEVVRQLVKAAPQHLNSIRNNTTPLFVACVAPHLNVVKLLIESGADPNSASDGHWKPLHYAAAKGYLEVVELLLGGGADLDLTARDGMTAMHYAAEGGFSKVVQLLLAKGADHNAKNVNNRTPLWFATLSGHVDVVKSLLEKGAEHSVPCVETGWAAITLAARHGYTAIAKLLLDAGADFTSVTDEGWTPLTVATRNGHDGVVKILLEKGADHSVPCAETGWAAIMLAARDGYTAITRLLLDAGADYTFVTDEGWTPLTAAAGNGHDDIVKILLDSGVDYTVPGHEGFTPLAYASFWGRAGIVKLLVERGADYNSVTHTGASLVDLALEAGQADVVRYLLDLGADYSPTPIQGRTPIVYAVHKSHLDTLQLLLDRRLESIETRDGGFSALDVAASLGLANIVKILLDHGADFDALSEDGWTPLGYAALNEHEEVIKLLLDAGADLNAPFRTHGSLLNWAAQADQVGMAKTLLEAGADLSITNPCDLTALFCASSHGSLDMMTLLIEHGANFDINTDDGLQLWSQLSIEGPIESLKLLIQHNKGISPNPLREVLAPIHLAAGSGHQEIVRLLLDTGASLAASDLSGMRPLHFAASHGQSDVVRLLAERGADTSAEDVFGRTAFFYAAYSGMMEGLEVLRYSDTVVSKTDRYGATPLAVAAHFGNKDLVEYLLSLDNVDARTPDHFGRTALSWARRAGHTAIAELLMSKLEVTELSADEVHDASEKVAANVEGEYGVCDVCMTPVGRVTFHCDICCHGDFDLCKYCKDIGVHCLDRDHNLSQKHWD